MNLDSSRLPLINFKLNTVTLCYYVHGKEFHVKNYEGHPCGIYEKVYALTLQIAPLCYLNSPILLLEFRSII